MKKHIFLLISILSSLISYSQTFYQYNQESHRWDKQESLIDKQLVSSIFQKSEAVFEGKITEYKQFYDTTLIDNDILITVHNVAIVKISDIVLAGNVNIGNISIIDMTPTKTILEKNGEISVTETIDDYIIAPPAFPNNGIYFCSTLPVALSGKSFPKYVAGENNSIVVSRPKTFVNIDLLELYLNSRQKVKFDSKEELYNYLKQFDYSVKPIKAEDKNALKEENKKSSKKKDASGSLNKVHKSIDKIEYQQAKAANSCQEFFISEYMDGPNKNKVLEIYNPSDNVKSLNGYSIKIFNNGAPTPLEIPLSGNVNPKETYVVAHPQAETEIIQKAHQTDVKMNFDGNDAVVLNKGQSTYIDKIGEIGVNPGQGGWSVPPSGSTKERDLRRKHPIDKGEIDWNQGKDQWEVLPNDSLSNIKKHNNACQEATPNEDIYYSFANPLITGDSIKFFEYDIMVSGSSSNTYLVACRFRIEYDTMSFGTSVKSNQNITITQGDNFDASSYINPQLSIQDYSSSVFECNLNAINSPTINRTQITPSPIQLMHIKLKIVNCGHTSNINFSDTAFSKLFSVYNTSETGSTSGTMYSSSSYGAELDETLCEFKIFSFNSPVYAGAYYTGNPTNLSHLTINGFGFGEERGTGNVYFKNSNNGGENYVPLDSIDLSWSNTQINIRMPSRVETAPFDNRIPSGGDFYVKTASGDSIMSNTTGTNFEVKYALTNEFIFGSKNRVDIANMSDSISILFFLGENIANHPDTMVEVIARRCVKEWSCNTLANYKVASTYVSMNMASNDGVSGILFVNSFPDGDVLMKTSRRWSTCIFGGDTTSYLKEVDIEILKDPTTIGTGTWHLNPDGDLPQGKRDFYEVMLHEVGHANLLEHVNDTYSLMFFTSKYSTSNDILEGNRRWIAANDAEGGINVVDRSVVIIPCSANPATYISNSSCANVTRLIERNNISEIETVLVYPNPISDSKVNIKYVLTKNSSVSLKMYNGTGQLITNSNEGIKAAGEYSMQINTNDLDSGIYFFILTTNQGQQAFKAIKM